MASSTLAIPGYYPGQQNNRRGMSISRRAKLRKLVRKGGFKYIVDQTSNCGSSAQTFVARSVKTTPFRWSISCWKIRAAIEPLAFTFIGWLCRDSPLTVTSKFRSPRPQPGTDRQPSMPSSFSSEDWNPSRTAFWGRPQSLGSMMTTFSDTPTCGVAELTPGASRTVSIISSTSVFIKKGDRPGFRRRTGSGKVTIGPKALTSSSIKL